MAALRPQLIPLPVQLPLSCFGIGMGQKLREISEISLVGDFASVASTLNERRVLLFVHKSTQDARDFVRLPEVEAALQTDNLAIVLLSGSPPKPPDGYRHSHVCFYPFPVSTGALNSGTIHACRKLISELSYRWPAPDSWADVWRPFTAATVNGLQRAAEELKRELLRELLPRIKASEESNLFSAAKPLPPKAGETARLYSIAMRLRAIRFAVSNRGLSQWETIRSRVSHDGFTNTFKTFISNSDYETPAGLKALGKAAANWRIADGVRDQLAALWDQLTVEQTLGDDQDFSFEVDLGAEFFTYCRNEITRLKTIGYSLTSDLDGAMHKLEQVLSSKSKKKLRSSVTNTRRATDALSTFLGKMRNLLCATS